ncbi:MAG: hypothetical protein A2270_03020 [Elusimicrobia bacterium RIFOXYA12_FULL_51_18]|nr:MAG: hypothetical protein A2270_03020 [Elusimicrobia bacterium RIFOXYA12_FULL_51_18]OGS28382.1 MAG: hypothetical protein A2218_06870 [Elusimicrobia bacterium RIFOXYA2_FULL_53_38]
MSIIHLQGILGDKYKVFDDGTDDSCRAERVGCQEIRGRYGAIYAYSDDTLAVRAESRRVGKKIESLGYKVCQRGDFEVVLLFPLTDFGKIAAIIKAQKRRQINPEQRTLLVARFNKTGKRPAADSFRPDFGPEERSFSR